MEANRYYVRHLVQNLYDDLVESTTCSPVGSTSRSINSGIWRQSLRGTDASDNQIERQMRKSRLPMIGSARAAFAAVKLEPVVDDVIAEFARDLVLELLDPVRLELDHVAGLDVDEMVVMVAAGLLET